MVGSQSQLIIDTAKAKKLPTMFQEQTPGRSKAHSRATARTTVRSAGSPPSMSSEFSTARQPKDLKIETVDSVELAINLQTAKQLGSDDSAQRAGTSGQSDQAKIRLNARAAS